MKKNTFNIIYTGYLDPHADKDTFVTDFCTRFRIPKAKAKALAESKQEVLLKKNLDIERAQKYHSTLKKMGMIVRMEANIPAEMDPTQSSTQIIPPPYDKTEITPSLQSDHCPNCGSGNTNDLSCLSCGHLFEDEDTLGETQLISMPNMMKKTTEPSPPALSIKKTLWIIAGLLSILSVGAVLVYYVLF